MTEVHDGLARGREHGGTSVWVESLQQVAQNKRRRVGSVVWNGSLRELLDLMAAVQHNCDCVFGATDVRLTPCSSHTMLARDQRAVDGLLWNRHLVKRLLVEEGISAP
jgi:hypothetical protein